MSLQQLISNEHSNMAPSAAPQDNSKDKVCYRHLYEREFIAKGEKGRMPLKPIDIQKDMDVLDDKSRSKIEHIWDEFKDLSVFEQRVVLQGIFNNSCSSLLSFASASLQSLVRLDFISLLPVEISFKILSYLDARSLCKAAQVCRRWRELADDDCVWHRMCEQHINRKCEKCGWGLPLMERRRLTAAKPAIEERFRRLTAKRPLEDASEAPAPANVHQKRARVSEGAASVNEEAGGELHVCNKDCTTLSACTVKPWKEVYAERCRVECNWRHGRYRQLLLEGHSDGIMALQLRGHLLASGSYDTTIRLWDMNTMKPIRLLEGHTSGVTCLQFDSCKLISGSMDKTIKIWNYRTGACLSTFTGHRDSVLCLAFDSTILVSGSADCTVKVWHFVGCKRITLRGHTGPVNSVKISRQRNIVYSCSDDNTIRLWSLTTNTCLAVFNAHIGPVQSLATTDSYLFSSSLDGTIKKWDVNREKCVETMFGHIEGVWDIAADRLRLISGAHDGCVKVWEASQCVYTLKDHNAPVTSVTLGDCEVIAGYDDGQISVWLFGAVPPSVSSSVIRVEDGH
ncbi:F-box/WD repeat protein Pof1 [Schizosaccharomyces japonicus yFS275]|uniref:F-box/WD repeat protein Pof1 n=1 Tax=Schizosaccharomyces japonicus (strain yFS275 / FY16936) TaxID=402676 RepID=B6JXQ1_SCHJY|nr:F-box/WD repeat protein Pof1 [Schizosaccharomyces japonicus yFS275]EEB05195.1 F-box/WD repeat protein Pof1 [Schizosaccharomyces japonicus yFS275]